jgi:hypothetical protein
MWTCKRARQETCAGGRRNVEKKSAPVLQPGARTSIGSDPMLARPQQRKVSASSHLPERFEATRRRYVETSGCLQCLPGRYAWVDHACIFPVQSLHALSLGTRVVRIRNRGRKSPIAPPPRVAPPARTCTDGQQRWMRLESGEVPPDSEIDLRRTRVITTSRGGVFERMVEFLTSRTFDEAVLPRLSLPRVLEPSHQRKLCVCDV